MATLVSPGVSVTVTDESFFIPVSASTVPLFFVATKAGKTQPDGITPAAGTLEKGVVRTVTSLGQSIQLYGIPSFRRDFSGNEYHGDARNEYGLLALNQFLGVGNRAFVVRADVDLDDEFPETFIAAGEPALVTDSLAFVSSASPTGKGTVTNIVVPSENVKPQTFTVTFTTATTFSVRGSVSGFADVGTVGIPFTSDLANFTVTAGSVPFVAGEKFTFSVAYVPTTFTGSGNGTMTGIEMGELAAATPSGSPVTVTFTTPTSFTVVGPNIPAFTTGTVDTPFVSGAISFLINDGTAAFVAGDVFTLTLTAVTVVEPLGANDDARRLFITTQLQAEINSNTEVRSELFEYNLILCPGYPEVVDELVALSVAIKDEAMVIADTPVKIGANTAGMGPDQVATWALTSERVSSPSVAYYYPWSLLSNLDGRNVLGAPSGTALRTIAYSDNLSYVWIAPAGVQRGLVTGVGKVGYITGTLGTATTFVEVNLNEGQRDNLYEYFKNINPIVFFPGRGLLVWGQKTSSPAASALDRINVVRLTMYLRRALRKGAMPFVFEPNDKTTRENLKTAADGILNDILVKRGLTDYATYCDENNNTPDRIDRNELWLDVAIKPTRAAEFIYIPIRVVSTGADI